MAQGIYLLCVLSFFMLLECCVWFNAKQKRFMVPSIRITGQHSFLEMNTELKSDLLNVCINHLEDLDQAGIRFVPVSRETLSILNEPPQERRGGQRRPVSRPVVSPQPTRTPRPEPVTISADEAHGEYVPQKSNFSDKERALSELKEKALACQKCGHLVQSRTQVVFGVGDVHADLMFVGEAPGAEEDAQGEPFVGKAGQLLTRIIQTMGLSRQTVYIANILKCRPDTPGQSSGNRKPRPEEMETCIPYLHAQIDIIQPKAIVALGATAVQGLLGETMGISRLRGNWQQYRGIPLMPTYHPSYLLRNQAPAVKREVWEDMLSVMTKLNMPISAKQQGYFLPKPGGD